ncbi:hypothetical protein GCM10010172_39390 [Paractinoplanes ferrugineus]|uniref:Uncharacterized protein n=1 Tax=Paractinoplanes ferrugineus TaxID=113564 RepID=A0A919J1G4_9ACTN|nr:hypothetical protein Afe05nite_45550 [Actinoplanes ferrugineus]
MSAMENALLTHPDPPNVGITNDDRCQGAPMWWQASSTVRRPAPLGEAVTICAGQSRSLDDSYPNQEHHRWRS